MCQNTNEFVEVLTTLQAGSQDKSRFMIPTAVMCIVEPEKISERFKDTLNTGFKVRELKIPYWLGEQARLGTALVLDLAVGQLQTNLESSGARITSSWKDDTMKTVLILEVAEGFRGLEGFVAAGVSNFGERHRAQLCFREIDGK